jgi:hypothetical protein
VDEDILSFSTLLCGSNTAPTPHHQRP